MKHLIKVCVVSCYTLLASVYSSPSFSSTAFVTKGKIVKMNQDNLLELLVPTQEGPLNIEVVIPQDSIEDVLECPEGEFELFENYAPEGTYTLISIDHCLIL